MGFSLSRLQKGRFFAELTVWKTFSVSSFGFSGLLAAAILRERLWFNYPAEMDVKDDSALSSFYRCYRKPIWIAFIALFVVVGIANASLGIYQKGTITQTTLPWGLNGVFKWLLLFGLATVATLFVRFEMSNPSQHWVLVMMLGLLESFVSNVSQLSRGMILNGGTLIYGALQTASKTRTNLGWRRIGGVLVVFFVLIGASVYSVNYIRAYQFKNDEFVVPASAPPRVGTVEIAAEAPSAQSQHVPGFDVMAEVRRDTQKLFIDRWVGMEGVMAVSAHPGLGWKIWKAAWLEAYNEQDTSLYDKHFIDSPYAATDKSKHHFISLPGVVAFFFYPGSYLFLFIGMFGLGLFAAFVEISTFKLCGGNMILCSLIAQVVAYRYASFGYVPQQSYLLFGTIFANLLIIFLLEKLFAAASRRYPALFNRTEAPPAKA